VSPDPAFVRRTAAGVTVELRAQPRARRTVLTCDGGTLKAQVTAPAEDGRANAAVIDLLAGTWRLPKSAFAVTRGATSREGSQHRGRACVARGEDHGMDEGVCGERWLKRN
jgi:uncharacterized protein YggU (UPF0235/DUF167 family)